ncbi:MAG: hypothetical protein RLZZ292_1584 [Bacteroidota bacterium]|jgi:coproporphyrinogen III oxidase
MNVKQQFTQYIHALQDRICAAIESCDGQARFVQDDWEREGGGGGRSRSIANGAVFEKGGVNTSIVHGKLPEAMQKQFQTTHEDFYATGISLVLHPLNPHAPTTHFNFRYFELYDKEQNVVDSWFGGGIDLTPYYLDNQEIIYFHQTLKTACDEIKEGLYIPFKTHCDDYFYIKHRQEMRGVGGIFYDYLRPKNDWTNAQLIALAQSCGDAFLNAYLPIVEKNKLKPYTETQQQWQQIRRGRYVEFNLVYDRGTLFGLKTNGRIESILMSLPPLTRWEYNHQPVEGSEEEEMLKKYQPHNWLEVGF